MLYTFKLYGQSFFLVLLLCYNYLSPILARLLPFAKSCPLPALPYIYLSMLVYSTSSLPCSLKLMKFPSGLLISYRISCPLADKLAAGFFVRWYQMQQIAIYAKSAEDFLSINSTMSHGVQLRILNFPTLFSFSHSDCKRIDPFDLNSTNQPPTSIDRTKLIQTWWKQNHPSSKMCHRRLLFSRASRGVPQPWLFPIDNTSLSHCEGSSNRCQLFPSSGFGFR